MVPGLNSTVYRVDRSEKELYDDLSAAELTLTGTAPSEPFRCVVELSSVTGHTDCAGTVIVGSETLTFSAARAKQTTVLLETLPVVTTSEIDCAIKITCCDAQGATIYSETEVLLKARWIEASKGFWGPSGIWTQSEAQVLTEDEVSVGDILRCDSQDYVVKAVDWFHRLAGLPVLRRAYL
jgi:hypothetical protein